MRTHLLSLLGIVAVLTLGGCGKDFCALGFIGSCNFPPHVDNQNGNNMAMDPTLNGFYATQVKIGQYLALNVTGGKKPYYSRSLEPTGCAEIDAGVTTFTPKVPGDCTITIVDSSATTQSVKQIIRINPAR